MITAATSPHCAVRKAGCRAAGVPVVFAKSKSSARPLCSPAVSVPEPGSGTAALRAPGTAPPLLSWGSASGRCAHPQMPVKALWLCLEIPGAGQALVAPVAPWALAVAALVLHTRACPQPSQGSGVPVQDFLSVRADYSAKAAMWQSCLHCFTELGCLLSPSIIFWAGNRILMVEVQIRFFCWTLIELAARGACWLCREQDAVQRIITSPECWNIYVCTKTHGNGLHFELLMRGPMLEEKNFSGDAKKTDLTMSLASTKGRTGVKWWLFPFKSHPPELYPPEKSRSICVSLFSWAQGRCVICAAAAEAMPPVQYQTARDHHQARASLVRWARNAYFYSFAGITIFYLKRYNSNFCSDMGLQFDVHLHTLCMLCLLFKIILQLIHLLLIHYLSSNKDVLLFAVAAYSAQHTAGWYFPSVITRVIGLSSQELH